MTRLDRVKRILPALAGGLLVGYVLLLLALTHYEQDARLEADASQARLGLEKRAAALSYFYEVRKDDLASLGEHRSVTAFFANRDLGMSMEYGLQASLLKMQLALQQLISQRKIDGQPVYLRILIRDPDGSVLVDSHPQEAHQLGSETFWDMSASQVVTLGSASLPEVLVVVPLMYKAQHEGQIIAWVNQTSVLHHLITEEGENLPGRVHLIVDDAAISGRTETQHSPSLSFDDTASEVRYLSDGSIQGQVRVKGTPFILSGNVKSSGFGTLVSNRWFTISLLILAVLLLFGVWLAVRILIANRVLRVRIDTVKSQEALLSQKNLELEQEIERRIANEQELIQARRSAEAASRAKSEFLATMSHEIRTPINGVLGMTELILNTKLNSEQRHLADSAYRSVLNLLALINDILDFSRIEAGRLELENKPFSPAEILEDVKQVIAVNAREKQLELRFNLAESVPKWLIGDGPRLRQILLNLAGNAVKFTQQGRVAVNLNATSEGKDRVRFTCAVEDTGIGIPAESQKQIFDSFSQVDSSTTRRFGGSGLGLAITRKLTQLMGGSIDILSEQGVGSTFTFSASFQVAPLEERQDQSLVSDADTDVSMSARILVADDNRINRDVVHGMLKLLGCEVVMVENGVAAVEACLNDSFDLVLMDCHMPELDGIEATQLIRENLHGPVHLPILALTADVQKGTRERCAAAGMDGYLGKPFTLHELRAALVEFLPVHLQMAPAQPADANTEKLPEFNFVPNASAPVLLDPEAFERIRMLQQPGEPSILRNLLEVFLQGAPQKVDEIHKAFSRGDANAVKLHAHSLKSSSANLGANQLSEICEKIEIAGHMNQLQDLRSALEELVELHDETAGMVERYLRECGDEPADMQISAVEQH